ncbi:RagB/SusD family nutrient uptake outer membrane protein [Sphingobacterium tabacisoli]|uniref:RagB/SusD family nutrient uptake outer membrane protein n=1 Tax=Sphingobacterium tabacisoli TaxID=2044855 RepID=A0ABW5L4Y5_9SPHI|nr:RagB/SusD family nutrient uptake outer membrane protein [Sphingobacterium tabacisoli]
MYNLRKHLVPFVSLILIGLTTASCSKDFLEIDPKGYLIAQKTADYDLMLNDPTLSVISSVSHIVMSDEVAASSSYFPSVSLPHQNAFRWKDDIYQSSDKTVELTYLVKQIYIYNKVINEVMASQGGSEKQKQALRAEALAGRAWCNFILANYYGKPYQASTAGTDLAAYLATEANVTNTSFERATVQATYESIIEDLKTAIPLLPNVAVATSRMSQPAAEALLAKVYVSMGTFDQALVLLESALTKLTQTGRADLYDLNVEFAPGGIYFPINPYFGPLRTTPRQHREIVLLRYSPTYYSYFVSALVMAPQTAALYGQTDTRLHFSSVNPFGEFDKVYPLGMRRGQGKTYSEMGISLADIYLLQAECLSRLGNTTAAVQVLTAFRSKRMPMADAPVPAHIASDQVALTEFIFQERIREFALHGERWFDMRRLSVDPIYKHTVGQTHTLYNDSGAVVEVYTLKPERLTFRFPQYIMAANPEMQQNP